MKELRLDCDGNALVASPRLGQSVPYGTAQLLPSGFTRDSAGGFRVEFNRHLRIPLTVRLRLRPFSDLHDVIVDRKARPVEGSYVLPVQ